MMKCYRIIYLLTLSVFISCTKEGRNTELVLDVQIQTSAEQSKAVYTGTKFPHNSSIVIFVYISEESDPMRDFIPYGDMYKNIRSTYASTNKWNYRLGGVSSSSSPFDDGLYIKNPTIETYTQGVCVCAYSPWMSDVTDIRDIPFSVGGQYMSLTDLMYADQNDSYTKIKPDGTQKSVQLTFKHALSMIRIGLKCEHDISTMTVTSITLESADGENLTPLYTSGRFNAVTGEFHDLVSGKSVTTQYKGQNNGLDFTFDDSEYSYVSFLTVPVPEYIDQSYILKFKFDNNNLSAAYRIRASDITVTRGGNQICAFEPGYIYTFNFVLDNYVQIKNVNIDVSSEWTEVIREYPF